MNTLPLIVAAILATLAVDLGAIDLSGADQVKEGSFPHPPGSVAFACLTPPQQTDSEPWGRGPDWYVETYTTTVRLWCPVENSTTDHRSQRARLIEAEVKRALDNVKATVGSALWRTVYWAVEATTPDPAAPNLMPGWAHTALRIDFTFRRQSGTGV